MNEPNKHGSPEGIDLLCANAASATYDQLSEENVHILKDKLLDITGCMFGGSIVKEDRFLTDYFKKLGGKREAPVFTCDFNLPLVNAVQLNSLFARANDFGAMFFYVNGEHIASHCSETLIPMGLTLAATRKVSGKEFIVNDIASEDLISRILFSLPVRWPTDMLLVSSAAAALASRYYGFNGAMMKKALSFAAANCTDPGNAYYDYSQEFKYHNAESARMGIMAVELAKGGWNGSLDPFFGHWGLVSKQVHGGGFPVNYEGCFNNLGKKFFMEQSFKRCPGGIPTTAAANCGKNIRAQIIASDGIFDAKKVKQVHVFRSDSVRYNYYSNPFKLRNHINALFSFQFAACCAMYHGNVNVANVQTDAILAHPNLYRLAEESTMDTFEYEKPVLKVVVDMYDGRTFTSTQDYAASMHAYPTKDFLEAKFRSQCDASGIIPKAKVDKLISLASRIENLSDMREYTELLQKGKITCKNKSCKI